jgi:hypothetical protein
MESADSWGLLRGVASWIDGWNTDEKSWSLALKTSFPGGCARFWHALHAAGFKRRRR